MWAYILTLFYTLFHKKRTRYNWKPDLPDVRDHSYNLKFPNKVLLQQSVDLSPAMPPVFDQGQLGSCTGNALAAALSYIHGVIPHFSRLFIYRGERAIEHTISQDAGAQIRDGVKFLSKAGCCFEATWPYTISKFAAKPPKQCFTEALNYKISEYIRLQTLDDMLQCLGSGFPFVFGFTVYENFESASVAKTGIVTMPLSNEKVVGGHAVTAVGYDLSKKVFKVRNSWGDQWGDKGYFYIPFDYLTNANLAADFWTLRK